MIALIAVFFAELHRCQNWGSLIILHLTLWERRPREGWGRRWRWRWRWSRPQAQRVARWSRGSPALAPRSRGTCGPAPCAASWAGSCCSRCNEDKCYKNLQIKMQWRFFLYQSTANLWFWAVSVSPLVSGWRVQCGGMMREGQVLAEEFSGPCRPNLSQSQPK